MKDLRLKHLGKLVNKYTHKKWLSYKDRDGNIGSFGTCCRNIWLFNMRVYGRFCKVLNIEITEDDIWITLDKGEV